MAIEGAAPATRTRRSPLHPNPFRTRALSVLDLPAAGSARVAVVDGAGRGVRTLVDGILPAGGHAIPWDGRTDRGTVASPGVYFVRLEAAGRVFTQKVTKRR